jgi:hypothetical protein
LKKIDDFIAFPEYLDLKPFIAPRKEEFGLRPSKIKDHKGAYDKQVLYRLYAVVVHIGNMVSQYFNEPLTAMLREVPARWSLYSIYSLALPSRRIACQRNGKDGESPPQVVLPE